MKNWVIVGQYCTCTIATNSHPTGSQSISPYGRRTQQHAEFTQATAAAEIEINDSTSVSKLASFHTKPSWYSVVASRYTRTVMTHKYSVVNLLLSSQTSHHTVGTISKHHMTSCDITQDHALM